MEYGHSAAVDSVEVLPVCFSQSQAIPNGILYLPHCGVRDVAVWRILETTWIQRSNLKAQEYGLYRQTALLGRDPDVCWVIARHVSALCPNHNGHDERKPIDGIDG